MSTPDMPLITVQRVPAADGCTLMYSYLGHELKAVYLHDPADLPTRTIDYVDRFMRDAVEYEWRRSISRRGLS